MKIEKRQRDGATILDLQGRITIGEGDVALREAVLAAVGEGATSILLNMGRVRSIDSSGVGELVAAYTTVTNRGGKLRLFSMPSRILGVLQITQLVTVLDILEDEDEAVASLA
ncbi:MAG: STAS domain-containing protein [Holophagales bacterium]|nr:STAS domain-containing protein [Holophagales bacterium]MYF05252.1 STAS domain-containing protein [Holophagales bacterium]MYJ23958.1 STAS domain-containing protein [Holophagales bacterium]